MSWPKVLVLAVALLLGLVLHGGLYEVSTVREIPIRTNRLTGTVEIFHGGVGPQRGWRRIEYPARTP